MSNNQDGLCQKLYELCENIMEHRLHDVERCLLLHNSKSDFRKVIDLDIKTGLNAYGSEMNLYDTVDGYQLENEYRLLLNGHNYFVSSSEIRAPKDKVYVLLNENQEVIQILEENKDIISDVADIVSFNNPNMSNILDVLNKVE